MQVSRQSNPPLDDLPPRGASARTRVLMVATAARMMRAGLSPSVSEVAEAAGVSRSTAYRYFPTLGDMLRAVVAEALGPILDWPGDEPTVHRRIEALYGITFSRIAQHEATFRQALRQSLEPGEGGGADASLGRGHRRGLLARATEGLGLAAPRQQRLIRALCLTFGVEALVVLKDICGLGEAEAESVAVWAAQSLVDAALREEAAEKA